MRIRFVLGTLALVLSSAVWAKLPPPPPVDPVKAAEAKAKQDETAAKDKALLATAEDRVAARYIKEQKAKGKDVKPQMAATAPAGKAAQPAKK
jgi:hypothetical protein